jgi:hypothetical protein
MDRPNLPAIAIVRLRDDRWARKSLCMPSPPPRAVWTNVVADSLERVWQACSVEDRARLAPPRSPEAREEELVRLDALLLSADPEDRAYAEARMLQLHLTR